MKGLTRIVIGIVVAGAMSAGIGVSTAADESPAKAAAGAGSDKALLGSVA